jgi:acyl-CoA dehydrogenase-like protein
LAARGYAEKRVQMGRPIARHELVADMLLDMEAEVAALRALVYRCTSLQDRITALERSGGSDAQKAVLQKELRDRTPLVKWLGAERALWVARTAVQVHGGYGVVQDYDVERHYRNALILPIYEGTSQIQALMSLKDQARWMLQRPWRLLGGAVRVERAEGELGESVAEMAREYGRALRYAVMDGLGVSGVAALAAGAAAGRPADLDRSRMAYALLSAERLAEMLALTRASEALAAHAHASPARRALAERYVRRALPLVRMKGEIVRSGDRSTLAEAGA